MSLDIAWRGSAGKRGRGSSLGFSLFETLIALLVFSGGSLALAHLAPQALALTQAALIRSQAALLAQAMVERMQANPRGLWRGDYEGDYPQGTGGAADCVATGCDADALAASDRQAWSEELISGLGRQVRAGIHCRPPAAKRPLPRADGWTPAYPGTCRLEIVWPALSAAGEVRSSSHLAWGF